MTKVTSTNTKAQILQAYEELLKTLKQERSQNTALLRELEEKKNVIQRAKSHSSDSAGKTIKELRDSFNQQIDKIEEGLEKEQKKFRELQEAIAIEQKNLNELYEINAEVDSLEALMLTNRQTREIQARELLAEKNNLEEEINAIQQSWLKEKEAYEYELKIKRRNEKDTYEQEKANLEKELLEKKYLFEKDVKERKQSLADQEQECKQLKKDVEQFEERLSKEVLATEEMVTKRITQELMYKHNMESKNMEAELKMAKQEISILNTKIEDQQKLVAMLQTKMDAASQQVKDIALKAIENAGIKSLNFPTERSKEDVK